MKYTAIQREKSFTDMKKEAVDDILNAKNELARIDKGEAINHNKMQEIFYKNGGKKPLFISFNQNVKTKHYHRILDDLFDALSHSSEYNQYNEIMGNKAQAVI